MKEGVFKLGVRGLFARVFRRFRLLRDKNKVKETKVKEKVVISVDENRSKGILSLQERSKWMEARQQQPKRRLTTFVYFSYPPSFFEVDLGEHPSSVVLPIAERNHLSK